MAAAVTVGHPEEPDSPGMRALLGTNIPALRTLLGLCTEELLLIGGVDLEAVCRSVEAFPRDWSVFCSDDGPAAMALSPKGGLPCEEEGLTAAFQEIRSDPCASYVGLEDVRLAKPFDPHVVLFRDRAWAKLATWVQEMIRLSRSLSTSQAPKARHAATALAAARCILGLAQIPLQLVPPRRTTDIFERCD
eukprot:s3471_g2.t2